MKKIILLSIMALLVLGVNAYAFQYPNGEEIIEDDYHHISDDGFVYTLEDGYACLTEWADWESEELIVPSVIEGYEVKWMNPVSNKGKLKTLIIPASIELKEYGLLAEYCENLESIELQGTYTDLGLFIADCPKLKSVIFSGENNTIKDSYGYGFKWNSYNCEPRVKGVNTRVFTTPLENVTIYAREGTDIEKFAKENGFEFKTLAHLVCSEWAAEELDKASKAGFVPMFFRNGEFKRNITREEFTLLALCFLKVQYGYKAESVIETWQDSQTKRVSDYAAFDEYEYAKTDRNGEEFKQNLEIIFDENDMIKEIINHNFPFKDIDSEYVNVIETAYRIGIVNGVSDTEFNPKGEITREQAAAMLMRVYENYADYEYKKGNYTFKDDADISDWAKDNVYAALDLEVMEGVGEDNFNASGKYTVEQAIATFYRLYDLAPISRKNRNVSPLMDIEEELKLHLTGQPSGSYFGEKWRKEYDDYIIVYGGWNRRHQMGTDYNLYVFYKDGGYLNLTAFVSHIQKYFEEITDVLIDEDKNTITFTAYMEDSFFWHKDLIPSKKVYGIGAYSFKADLQTGRILDIERVIDDEL